MKRRTSLWVAALVTLTCPVALGADPPPSAAVALARARAKLGLLVEARDALTSVVYGQAPAGEPPAAAAMRAEAKRMFTDLASRIPHVRVTVDAPPGGGPVALELDGEPLPAGAARMPIPVDPGHHVLVATTPGVPSRTFIFDAVESTEGAVAVHLVAAPATVAAPAAAPVPPSAQSPAPPSAPPPPPALPPPPRDPPISERDDRLALARRAKFSVGRFFLESLGSAVVGSLAAYGTYKATCGDQPCLGGSFESLGVNILVTPVTVWGLGQATGGDGGLGWTFVGGLLAFSGYTAGTTDPTLPLVVGVILMPFTSALLYEVSSNSSARRVLGPNAAFVPTLAPLYGPQNAVVGASGGVQGRF